jgi:hypothetical protein
MSLLSFWFFVSSLCDTHNSLHRVSRLSLVQQACLRHSSRSMV